jgi:hypothetical protein
VRKLANTSGVSFAYQRSVQCGSLHLDRAEGAYCGRSLLHLSTRPVMRGFSESRMRRSGIQYTSVLLNHFVPTEARKFDASKVDSPWTT